MILSAARKTQTVIRRNKYKREKEWETRSLVRKMNPSAAFFCLCMVAVYSAGEKASKTKRDVSGLYPFPRVGKGDALWNPLNFGPQEMKRQGLIPFPRVGRNRGDEESGKKRDVSENGGGMWFGPRLGRLQKRNHFNDDSSWALVQIKDLKDIGDRRESLTSRLSSDSSEDTDQGRDYRI